MRSRFLVIFCFVCSLTAIAQEKEKSISLTFNNSGLIGDLLDIYHKNFNVQIPLVAKDLTESRIKFDLSGEFEVKDKVNLIARIGYGSAVHKGKPNGMSEVATSKQSFSNVSVGFLYKIDFEKLRLSTGLEIPFYLIGNYNLDYKSPEIGNEYIYTLDIKGGFATGLINSTSLKYMIGSKTYLTTTIAFGLVYSQISGGPSLYSVDYVDPNRDDNVLREDWPGYSPSKFQSRIFPSA